jgi:O-antigen/teichoic acid export membrane protein
VNILAGLFVESTLPYLVILGIATVVVIAIMFMWGWKLRVEKEKKAIKEILIGIVLGILAMLLMDILKGFGLHPRTSVAITVFLFVVVICLLWLFSKLRVKDNKPEAEQKDE